MKIRNTCLLAAVLAGASTLYACADAPRIDSAPRVEQRIEYGVVERIDLYREGNSAPEGLGMVLGGIAGGVLGHQVGSGRGKDLATVAGAVGGAYAGHQMQQANSRDRYRIGVRLDNGTRLEVTEVGEGQLRVGDRVRVVDGRVFRD